MNSEVTGQDVANALFWVSTGFLVLGLILTVLFTVLWIVKRSKPVAPAQPGHPPAPRGGGCLLAVAIVSFVFLVLGPIVGMVTSSFVDDLVPARRTYASPDAGRVSNASAARRDTADAREAIDRATRDVGDSALERRIADIGATMRSNLPQRNGPATLYDVQVAGAELILSVNLSQDFSGAEWNAFDEGVRGETCSGQFAEVIRDGGGITYRVQDSGGETHMVSVTSCR